MKKLAFFLFLFLFIALASTSFAEHYGYAVIDAQTSDRVHLRAHPSTAAASMGLYFTGTWASCFAPPQEEWVPVQIGQMTGYIMSRYLKHESSSPSVVSRQPAAVVDCTSWINLRSMPSMQSDVLRRLPDATPVTLLGETADGWYYVRTEDCLHGYVKTDFISLLPASVTQEKLLFSMLPSQWMLSSGAGAWCTELTLFPDGHFEGAYHDSDMGDDGPGYPNGTVYTATFYGLLSQPVRISDTVWQATVTEYEFDGVAGQERIEDGVLYVTTPGLGLAQNDTITIYLPGTEETLLPEDFSLWVHTHEGGRLETYALYNNQSDLAFESQ